MSRLTLQRNVQFLYEEQLARMEAAALGCRRWKRNRDNPWRVNLDTAGRSADLLRRLAYVGEIDGRETVYAQLIRPNYQGGQFNRTRSVNQYLTHWIYPYQGKFHPQMVRALLNISGAGRGSLVLDPYAGSGTTVLEAALLGMRCIGIDMSPLCVLLTRVKVNSVQAVEPIRERVRVLLDDGALDPEDAALADHPDTRVSEFVQIARMVALSDVARRRRDGPASFRKNLKAMLQSVGAHAGALARFEIEPGAATVARGDAGDLAAAGIHDSTVDAVVTSPPYSIALDYVKNDEHALRALGVDLPELRASMTGVRGARPNERLTLYNQDMQRMFREVARVLKPAARALFVIGNATVDRNEYTTTEQMSEWAIDAGMEPEHEIPKIVFGLYNVMRDEKILVFRNRGG